jgi:flavin-dependent dehydrogenase
METTFDTVVVGARVAGAATGLHLSRLGHKVLIVDRTGPPTDTLSTHALMRTAVLQLDRAGVLDEIRAVPTPEVRRITLGFFGQSVSFDVRHEFGIDALYAPRRSILDSILLEAARAAGAEVALGHAVADLSRSDDGSVDGVVLRSGARIRARVVVGADGRNSAVAKLAGAPVERFVAPTNAVTYSYFEGLEDVGFDFRFGPGVATGAITTNDGLTLVMGGVPSATFDGPEPAFRRALEIGDPDLARSVAGARRVERFHFTPGIASHLRVPAGPGWVLVGDAGFTKDPLSAHGISCALRDAELAARAIHRGLVEPESARSAADEYHRIRNRFALPILELTSELAAYRWDAARASALMRGLGRITDDECAHLTSRAPASGLLVA